MNVLTLSDLATVRVKTETRVGEEIKASNVMCHL